MNEITQEIHSKLIAEFKPLAEKLLKEGKTQQEVVKVCNNMIQGKVCNYYKKGSVHKVGVIAKQLLDNTPADSKAEIIFYGLLTKNNIDFKFQYPIGPYRVDFFVEKDLIVELDGPQHNKERDEKRDKYLQSQGYRILRVPIALLAHFSHRVIEGIKNLM
jgi:very-short-patch-repair endonuclease